MNEQGNKGYICAEPVPAKDGPLSKRLAALKASLGYLLNAKIDLETGAPKKTAIQTLDGGIARVRAALTNIDGQN